MTISAEHQAAELREPLRGRRIEEVQQSWTFLLHTCVGVVHTILFKSITHLKVILSQLSGAFELNWHCHSSSLAFGALIFMQKNPFKDLQEFCVQVRLKELNRFWIWDIKFRKEFRARLRGRTSGDKPSPNTDFRRFCWILQILAFPGTKQMVNADFRRKSQETPENRKNPQKTADWRLSP